MKAHLLICIDVCEKLLAARFRNTKRKWSRVDEYYQLPLGELAMFLVHVWKHLVFVERKRDGGRCVLMF